MDTFKLKIVASNKVFYDGDARELVLPISDGLKGFLAHHENVVAAIEFGEMKIVTDEDEVIEAFVGDGYIEFFNNCATVVCISVELPEEIDARRAEEAVERAQEELRQHYSIIEYHQSQTNLARAMERLKVKKRHEI